MFSEDSLLPISALQHLLFCERQCALIHIERVWVENRLTIEGRHLHQKTHGETIGPRGGGAEETRRGPNGEIIRVARAVSLRSLRLGLFGVADVVEFHPIEPRAPAAVQPAQPLGRGFQSAVASRSSSSPADAATGLGDGGQTPFPIEYKRGRPKKGDYDRVQLCAQALCLEEMLGAPVPSGALFYGRTRRRQEVALDAAMRALTERAAARLHELIGAGRTPTARREPKCKRCSLLNVCMPDATAGRSVSRYVRLALSAPETGP